MKYTEVFYHSCFVYKKLFRLIHYRVYSPLYSSNTRRLLNICSLLTIAFGSLVIYAGVDGDNLRVVSDVRTSQKSTPANISFTQQLVVNQDAVRR